MCDIIKNVIGSSNKKNDFEMATQIKERKAVMRSAEEGLEAQRGRYYLKMSANGQVTIPKEIREEFGWRPGDVLVFSPREKGFEVFKQLNLRDDMKKWREKLSEETNNIIQKTAGWSIAQYHEYFDNLPENVEEMERKYGFRES